LWFFSSLLTINYFTLTTFINSNPCVPGSLDDDVVDDGDVLVVDVGVPVDDVGHRPCVGSC
jgi:hypothetical protein